MVKPVKKGTRQKPKKKTYSIVIKRAKTMTVLVSFILIICFIVGNIYYSQTISPLYFSLVNESRSATIEFLTKIKSLPVFSSFLTINKNIYSNLEAQVNLKENQIKQEISVLEKLLVKNSKARDVLLRLSRLYKQLGDEAKAGEYLKKAKEIDPEIKILNSNI